MDKNPNDVSPQTRYEIYDHQLRPEKGFGPGVHLKPVSNMTQGQRYEILEEKFHPHRSGGMIYVVKDDEGNTRHVSDKYFYQTEPVLVEPKQSDNKLWEQHCFTAAELREAYDKQPHLREIKDKMKGDFDVDLSHMPPIPGVPPTVEGLTKAAESMVEYNRLAGTYKEKKTKTSVRKKEDARLVKSSIEEELDVLRDFCVQMIDRIDKIYNAVETVRKFA